MTDHKPLLGVFKKPLSETPNPRLQSLRLKVVGANVRLTWDGGKHNSIADALSRALVSAAALLDAGEQQEEAVFVRALAEGYVEAAGWLYLDAQEDDDYQKLLGALPSKPLASTLAPTMAVRPMQAVDWTSSMLGVAITSSWWTGTPGTHSCNASLIPRPPR